MTSQRAALMEYDKNRLVIKLAETEAEILGAQRLRYRVFVEEMGAKAVDADHQNRLEQDRFDAVFDHLILIDTSIEESLDQVIGAYRLMTNDVALERYGFYGASEYDLGVIERLDRKSVELGRSCVAAPYRGGAAMHILWNGLAEYVLSRDIEILFGVASFHGTDPAKIAPALSHLHHNALAPPDLRVRALSDNAVDMNIIPPDQVDPRIARRQIPSLIKAYLRLGGFVGDGAYIDYDFNTIDVCLLMDTKRMVARYHDYYTKHAS